VQERATSGQLAGQLGDELARLLRCDAELAMAERMPEIRRAAGDAAVLAAGVVALLFALAGGSWAAALGIATEVPGWAAALAVAGAWSLVAAVALFVYEHPRRLVSRLSDQTQAEVIQAAQAERSQAEQSLRVTAAQLAEALFHEAEARAMHSAASAVSHGVDEAEHEAGRLISQLADALREPGKAGHGLLEWLKGDWEGPSTKNPA
jgi:hypothetical protein